MTDGLAQIHQACWQALADAARQKDHAWRLMALATVHGDAADLRTVVLREVDASRQTLVFFTDARSPKVGQIQTHPLATLMVWSAGLAWQLRLRVLLTVQTSGPAVAARWARIKQSPAALDYLSPLAPGAPLPAGWPGPTTPLAAAQFAVVTATVQSIDWLALSADGHRRASFDAEGRGTWLTP